MRLRLSLPTALVLALSFVLGSCTSSTEPPQVTAIQLSPTSPLLDAIGATQQVTPTVLDQRGAPMSTAGITWGSNAAGIATVSQSGLITAVANGTATVSATKDGIAANVQVQVTQTPIAPVAVAGNAQSGPVNQQLANQLQVRIEDRLGNVMPGRPVTFAVTSGGGSISTTTANSDVNGLASTTWTLGSTTVALHRVSAAVAGNGGVTFFTATALAGPAVQMNVAPGNAANGQSVMFGTAVPIKPAVEVVDVLGNGVAGVTVTFSVGAGGGSVTGASAVTNSNGVATVGSWTLGPNVGVNTLQASLGALTPVIFTVNATLDPCTPAGAPSITVGVTKNSNISATDCQMPSLQNFEYFKFDLAASTSLMMEMTTAVNPDLLDPWLALYDVTGQTLIAENDDILSGVIRNSRIAITLPAGSYLLRAGTFYPGQGGDYSLLVRTALLGVPANVVLNSGNGQVSAPGAPTAIAPSVKVTDEADIPVAGVTVNFATVPGFGSVTGASALTNASGIATVGSWSLAPGANVLSATVSGASPAGNPVVFSATGKAATSGFDIGLRFVAMPTASQLQTFSDAAARWETVIAADVAAWPLNRPAGSCTSPVAINETIDDVVIVVRLEPIDGVGRILGSAGPCYLRDPGFLPILGMMNFDTADLANLETAGSFGNVILHEMGHVLGIGTIWSNKGFLINASTATAANDTYFSGPLAIAAFNTVGGSTYTQGMKVPVENRRDTVTANGTPVSYAGTRNSHWRETVLQNELMTGFLQGGSNPLSALTSASLQDIGYSVNMSAADPFFVATSLRLEGEVRPAPIDLRNDVRTGPIYTVDRSGRVAGEAPRTPAPNKLVKRPK